MKKERMRERSNRDIGSERENNKGGRDRERRGLLMAPKWGYSPSMDNLNKKYTFYSSVKKV